MKRAKKLVALLGYAGAGKSTAAQLIQDHFGGERISFATNVRKVLYALNWHIRDTEYGFKDACEKFGYDEAKKQFSQLRPLLVSLGEGLRTYIDENIWIYGVLDPEKVRLLLLMTHDNTLWQIICFIDRMSQDEPMDQARVQAFRSTLRSVFLGESFLPVDLLIVDDCRKPIESIATSEQGGIVILIERPGVGAADATEGASVPKSPCDYRILNNGTKEELAATLLPIVAAYLNEKD